MLGKELALQGKAESNGMVIESYRGTVTLTLSACGKQSQFPTKPITKAELDSFRRLDFTDLGDMEDDPMVHHIEQLLGGHQH
jgi:hypothetical protein